MKLKFLSILLLFLTIQMQAQNQMITHKCHTTFSNKSHTSLPLDWSFDGNSHQITIDSLNQNESGVLKIYGCQDSIVPSVLTLTVLPVNNEDRAFFSMKVKTKSENDSLLIVVSTMDTTAMQCVKECVEWKEYRVNVPLNNNSQIMIPQIAFFGTGPYWISETTVDISC